MIAEGCPIVNTWLTEVAQTPSPIAARAVMRSYLTTGSTATLNNEGAMLDVLTSNNCPEARDALLVVMEIGTLAELD